MHWQAISPDLTRNDKSKQSVSGGEITLDDSGTEYYDTIFALAESPITKGLLWVGTDDGLIQITRDEGKNWSNITPKDLPEWSRISQIEASPHDAGTAYVAVDRHQSDDLKPYIYKTSDYGQSWTKLNNGIPDGSFVRAVREDPKKRGLTLRGNREWSLRFIQRWCGMEVAQTKSAHHAGARSGGQRQRSGSGHAWACILDSG